MKWVEKGWNKKEQNMLILVDGFICSVAFLIAFKKKPSVIKMLFFHSSTEQGRTKNSRLSRSSIPVATRFTVG
jgi:NaMN:DMB phosphoribosyltransferase